MTKRIISLCVSVAVATMLTAQTKDGGISAQMLKQMQGASRTNAMDKALSNAIASNPIDDLA